MEHPLEHDCSIRIGLLILIMGNLILGTRVDPTSYPAAIKQVLIGARARESRYVCVPTVHMVMEAHDSSDFKGVVNGADLTSPDGMPLVWSL